MASKKGAGRVFMMKVVKKVLKKILPKGVPDMYRVYKDREIKGFLLYGELVHMYGSSVRILGTAWRGTGDYFFCGMYLRKWLEKNGISNYVFLIPDSGGEKRISQLFSVFENHSFYCRDVGRLYALSTFLQWENPLCENFHHGSKNPYNSSETVAEGNMNGYKDWNMIDFYLHFGFCLPVDTVREMPRFDCDEQKLRKLFMQKNLNPGRTAVLSPYSTGLKEFMIPFSFWESVASYLLDKGFTVATNCFGNETAVNGTVCLMLDYALTVPFLDYNAGNGSQNVFIGIRSGLCDIIASSHCKKIVIHTYRAQWWPDGKSMQYTSLNAMGLCNDAIEYEWDSGKDEAILADVKHEIERAW